MTNPIKDFSGEYAFLSNFYYPAIVFLDGIEYKTTEHAYQAAKTHDKNYRLKIKNAPTAAKAKKLGQKNEMKKHHIEIRGDWESVKLNVMLDLLKQKFEHTKLKQKLLDTGDAHLVEGNYWQDRFWGICDGKGENHLGRLLMKVRDELSKTKNDINDEWGISWQKL